MPTKPIEEEMAPSEPLGTEPTLISPMGVEPASPSQEWREETDATGQRWRVDKVGRRLKIGGDHDRPGAPKKAIREEALGGAGAAVKDDLRIMRDPNADPLQKEKAKDRLYRYGLGTQDEITQLKSDEFIKAHARACAKAGLDAETTLKLTDLLNEEMGIKE